METPMTSVKLTINIDPDLRRRLKVHAARCDTTIAALVRDWIKKGLREAHMPSLAAERPKASPPPIPLMKRIRS